jgi:hypothetical protein
MLILITGQHDFTLNKGSDKVQKWAEFNEMMFTDVTHARCLRMGSRPLFSLHSLSKTLIVE